MDCVPQTNSSRNAVMKWFKHPAIFHRGMFIIIVPTLPQASKPALECGQMIGNRAISRIIQNFPDVRAGFYRDER